MRYHMTLVLCDYHMQHISKCVELSGFLLSLWNAETGRTRVSIINRWRLFSVSVACKSHALYTACHFAISDVALLWLIGSSCTPSWHGAPKSSAATEIATAQRLDKRSGPYTRFTLKLANPTPRFTELYYGKPFMLLFSSVSVQEFKLWKGEIKFLILKTSWVKA